MHTLSPNAVKRTRFHSSRRLAVKSEDGVTLLELITSIAVIGVLVLIVVLSFGGVTADAKQAAVDAAASSAYKMGTAALVEQRDLDTAVNKAQTRDVTIESNGASEAENLCVTAIWADDESISAKKGSCGSDDSGGVESGEPADAVWTYSCGPITVNVTQESIDQSLANNAAIAAGDLEALNSDSNGVVLIFSTDTYGPITNEVKPGGVILITNLPALLAGEGGAGVMATRNSDYCDATDYRLADSLNEVYRYKESYSPDYVDIERFAEARQVSVNGERFYETVSSGYDWTSGDTGYKNEVYQISRHSVPVAAGSTTLHASNAIPAKVQWEADGGELSQVVEKFVGGSIDRATRSITVDSPGLNLQGTVTESCIARSGSATVARDDGSPCGRKWGQSALREINGQTGTNLLAEWNATHGNSWSGKVVPMAEKYGDSLNPSFTPSFLNITNPKETVYQCAVLLGCSG